MEKQKTQHVDTDYSLEAVPTTARKGFGPMFVIMMGFTFFSASMSAGARMANGMDLGGFIWALILGSIFLGAYTGILAYIGGATGLSFDLLAHRSFGTLGSYLPSAMISSTQIGWFGVGAAMFAFPVAEQFGFPVWVLIVIVGVCMTASAYFGIKGLEIVSWISVPLIAILGIYSMVNATVDGGGLVAIFNKSTGSMTLFAGVAAVIGSFISGGTATPNFARFGKSTKSVVLATVIAFTIGNILMFCFGAVGGAFTGKDDIFYVMIAQGLAIPAIIVLGANIWTTNDNALYTGSLGLSNITKVRKRPMVIVSGILGTVLAVWLYNNFIGWLNFLNATLPPIGAIIMLDFFLNRSKYGSEEVKLPKINWAAIAGVVAGALVGNFITWGVAAINAMVVAALIYYFGNKLLNKQEIKA